MLKWNQLNIVQKGILEQIITYGTIFLISLLVLSVTAYDKVNHYGIEQQTSKIEQITSNRRYHHEKNIQQQALQGNSSNPIMNTLLQNRTMNEQPLRCIRNFFSTYYTYSSKGMYENRSNKIKNITTPNIFKNKYWFNPSYDGKNSVISDMTSTEMSHGGNNDNLLVECHTTTWLPPSGTSTGESDKRSVGQWYALTYNSQSRKITNLQKLYTNSNISNDFNTTSTTESGSGVYY